MSLLVSLLSKNEISNTIEKNLIDSTSKQNLYPKSDYRSADNNFISLNFSNRNLDSDISVCDSSGIIVNFIGDITNRAELLEKLHLSKDVRNSVIISHAFKKWGDSFAIKIYGFFSIIIYKSKEKSIIAINDHLGSKPIYYFKSPSIFLISSKINTILSMIAEKKPNHSRIRDYFIFYSGKPGETFFDDIHNLEPGSQLTFNNDSISIKKYFNYDLTKKISYKDDYEYEENFKEIFSNSILALSDNLGNQKIGSSLSGGLDSSSITCMLKHLEKNVIPQSVLFEGLNAQDHSMVDERAYVKDVSKKYNLKIDYIPLEDNGCISELPQAINYNDEPPSLINGYVHTAIFKNLKSKNINTLFDGFDGDTTVSYGYEHLFELGRKFRLINLMQEYTDMHKNRGIKKINYLNAIKQYLIKSYIPSRIFWFKKKYGSSSMVPLEWSKKLNSKIIKPPSYKEIYNNYRGLPIPNYYQKSSQFAHYLSITDRTIQMSLNLINHNASEYGVDIKFPFMDRKLIEFCLSIPSNQKLKNGVSRSILRRSLRNIIPDTIYTRYTKSDLSPFSRNQICNVSNEKILKSAENISFFDTEYIKSTILKNKSEHMVEIYQIIIFEAWLKKHNF